ncbi:MAG: T9SS type A sorting domain-containing protein [Bacteroidales bacterium]
MKKSLFVILFSLGLFIPSILSAQSLFLTNVTNQSVRDGCEGTLYDSGEPNNNYENNTSYWRAFCPSGTNTRISLSFEEFNIHSSDKFEIYTGTSPSGIAHLNASGEPYFTGRELEGQTIKAKLIDTSGCLTVRLVTDSFHTSSGFVANIQCEDYCQSPFARLDTFFTKVDAQGQLHNIEIKDIIDTVYYPDGIIYSIENYKSIDICKGDSIILRASPLFPENDMPRHQTANTCIYEWSFGDGETQTIYGNTTVGHRFNEGVMSYLGLVVHDTSASCSSTNDINTKVRISVSKIREIKEDLKICSGSVFYLSLGNDEDNTVVLGDYEGTRDFSYQGAKFIPDGPDCGPIPCLEVPINVEGFPTNSTIKSPNDILSICTNMEHSHTGDLLIEIVCPNGESTFLKHYTMSGNSSLGIANRLDNGCLPENNPQGIGWNYCYSNQLLTNQSGVISGGSMNSPIDSTEIYSQSGYFQTPIQNATNQPGWETTDLNGFETLVGCPINGEWNLRICDIWRLDNGYLFSWDIDFSNQLMSETTIKSKIDSIKLIGEGVTPITDNKFAVIMPQVSPGTINYILETYDDFGCKFDTIIPIRVLQGPIVELGSRDTSIFEPTTFTVPYSEDFTYLWYPTNDTTNTLTTPLITECDSIINYYLVVMGEVEGLQCVSSDYIQVNNNPTPLTPVYLEGHANITEEEQNIVITWLSNALTYDVYRNDEFVATATSRIYVDNNIVEGQDYCYTIRAKNNYCESAMSEEICKTAIGLNDLRETSPIISLYPNPTSSKANIEIKGLSTKAEIQLIDIQGRILKSYTLNPNSTTLEMDLRDLSKGLYNVRIDTKTNTIIKKIIKE